VAGIAEPAKCVAAILCKGASDRCVDAGKEVSVTAELRDRFGNFTTIAGERCGLATTTVIQCTQ